MSHSDRSNHSIVSGATGGFIASFIGWLIVFSPAQIVAAFFAGLVGMFILGIAGSIKGDRENYNFTLSSWTITGFFTTVIVSIPIWPMILFGLIFTMSSEYEDSRPVFLAILPIIFAIGALGGFIAGIISQRIENRYTD